MEKQTLTEYIRKLDEAEAIKEAHNICMNDSAFQSFLENVEALDFYVQRKADELFSLKVRLDESPIKYNEPSKYPYEILVGFEPDANNVVIHHSPVAKNVQMTDIFVNLRRYLQNEYPIATEEPKSKGETVIESLKAIQKELGGNIRIGGNNSE